MRFLICGLGSIGNRHLQNLEQLGEKDIILYRTYKSILPQKMVATFLSRNPFPIQCKELMNCIQLSKRIPVEF